MNKILPIILVVVLSGCATKSQHGTMLDRCIADNDSASSGIPYCLIGEAGREVETF